MPCSLKTIIIINIHTKSYLSYMTSVQCLYYCYKKQEEVVVEEEEEEEAMEEALRKVAETWKQCPQEALLLLISICLMGVVVGLCVSAVSRKKRGHRKGLVGEMGAENGSGWGAIKRVLMGSVRWSERASVDLQKMPALLAGCREVEWSEMSSPLWQRRILMGERCELPKFSGLILYDERGQPLRHSHKASSTHQVRPTAAVTTTLRDLL